MAGGWIAYAHLWRDGGATPLLYRDLTAALPRLEPPVETRRRFRHRDQLATYVRAVRPGEPLSLPRIDFAREEAVLVAAGPRSSTGYTLQVTSAREVRGRVLVVVRERTPTLGEPQQAHITYPYRLLVFRKVDKPLYFELQGRP